MPSNPTLLCDLVMKGGVTSGVVYPPAIAELQRVFRFRNVGGASAGAIAAAAAACAEHGRLSNAEGAGFAGLADLQAECSAPGFLLDRFKPHPKGRRLFDLVIDVLKLRGQRSVRAVLGLVDRHTQPWLSIGASLGGALTLLVAWPYLLRAFDAIATLEPLRVVIGCLLVLSVLLAAGLALAAGALGGALLGAYTLCKPLTDKQGSMFGICWGSDGRPANLNDGSLALIDWLHTRFQKLGGQGVDGCLTMGDLKAHRDVTLKLVTTNLNLCQPYLLPMKRGARSFFFDRAELERLFPAPVIAYLERKWVEKPLTKLKLEPSIADRFIRLPLGDDLPVIVATRMSLSFPLLISAVRLFSFTQGAYERGIAGPDDVEEHWFSDGGIASNFPIHVFDGWLPDVPTFGITLYDSPVSSTLGQREAGPSVVLPRPSEFDYARPQRVRVDTLLDFFRAIFETAQSYRDNAQSALPGYRERIAQVFLEKDEGGLNLTMPSEVIERIQEKGRRAGQLIVERYAKDGAMSDGFLEHRWVKLQVVLAQLEKELGNVAADPKWADAWKRVIAAQLDADPRWYRWHKGPWCNDALDRVTWLAELATRWRDAREKSGVSFATFPPLPESVLRIGSPL